MEGSVSSEQVIVNLGELSTENKKGKDKAKITKDHVSIRKESFPRQDPVNSRIDKADGDRIPLDSKDNIVKSSSNQGKLQGEKSRLGCNIHISRGKENY